MTGTGGSISKIALPHNYGQETTVPHQVNLFIGLLACPHNLGAGFPQTKRKNKKEAAMSFTT